MHLKILGKRGMHADDRHFFRFGPADNNGIEERDDISLFVGIIFDEGIFHDFGGVGLPQHLPEPGVDFGGADVRRPGALDVLDKGIHDLARLRFQFPGDHDPAPSPLRHEKTGIGRFFKPLRNAGIPSCLRASMSTSASKRLARVCTEMNWDEVSAIFFLIRVPGPTCHAPRGDCRRPAPPVRFSGIISSFLGYFTPLREKLNPENAENL